MIRFLFFLVVTIMPSYYAIGQLPNKFFVDNLYVGADMDGFIEKLPSDLHTYYHSLGHGNLKIDYIKKYDDMSLCNPPASEVYYISRKVGKGYMAINSDISTFIENNNGYSLNKIRYYINGRRVSGKSEIEKLVHLKKARSYHIEGLLGTIYVIVRH